MYVPVEAVWTVPRTPDDAIARPVIVQTIIVSINVPHILINPCLIWLFVVAAAAEIAAEPRPASFEKHPLATPNLIEFITDAVIVPHTPPPTDLRLNAIANIILKPAGTSVIFPKITITPQMI